MIEGLLMQIQKLTKKEEDFKRNSKKASFEDLLANVEEHRIREEKLSRLYKEFVLSKESFVAIIESDELYQTSNKIAPYYEGYIKDKNTLLKVRSKFALTKDNIFDFVEGSLLTKEEKREISVHDISRLCLLRIYNALTNN